MIPPERREELEASIPRIGITGVVLLAMLVVELNVLVSIRIVVVPKFTGMFADFGAALPRLTVAVLGWTWYAGWAAAALGVAACSLLPSWRSTRLALLCVAVALPLVAVFATIGALYLPIFTIDRALQ